MAGARLILWEKKTDERGNLRELVIWKVKETAANPEGVRYRLALKRKGEKISTVLYDNHHPKGHHRHVQSLEQSIALSMWIVFWKTSWRMLGELLGELE